MTPVRHMNSARVAFPMQWRPATPSPTKGMGAFETELEGTLTRLRDANLRVTFVSVRVPQLSGTIVAGLARMATSAHDPFGVLDDGGIYGLLLDARPAGPTGDVIVMGRFLSRLLFAAKRYRSSLGQVTVLVESVHRWVGEIEGVQDLIGALSLTSARRFDIAPGVSC